jgi:hypothetical protein
VNQRSKNYGSGCGNGDSGEYDRDEAMRIARLALWDEITGAAAVDDDDCSSSESTTNRIAAALA